MSSTPYYSDDLVTLYHGDSREIDEWLTADVLVTDPPYGREWRQGEIKRSTGRASAGRDGIAGDSDTATRDNALALWGPRRAVAFGDLMLPPPAGTKLVSVYRKPPDSGMRGAIAGRRRDLEAIYFLGPWPSGLGGATSLFATSARTVGNPSGLVARYGHPHAKPLDVMHELVSLATRDEVVADPFSGAGSTLIAAALSGRKAVGVEIEERYCERIAARLSESRFVLGEAV